MTKNIAGKELFFLKGGKYIEEKISDNNFSRVFKGKDFETEEIVVIRQFKKEGIFFNDKEFYNEVNTLKNVKKN